MKTVYIILLVSFFSTYSKSQSTKLKYSLTLKKCDYSPKSGLRTDTLLLTEGIHPFRLKKVNSRKLKFYQFEENYIQNCNNWKATLKEGKYQFLYVNHVFNTLAFKVNLAQDTFIDLNKLEGKFYTKVEPNQPLLDKIEEGDKITIAIDYFDCPTYSTFQSLTFKKVTSSKMVALTSIKTHKKKVKVYNQDFCTQLRELEKKVNKLPFGKRLQILIKKNQTYKVVSTSIEKPWFFPNTLKEFWLTNFKE